MGETLPASSPQRWPRRGRGRLGLGMLAWALLSSALPARASLDAHGADAGPGSSLQDDVVHLDRHSFAAATASGGALLVEFFAPWCPHCQHYRPTWRKVAAQTAHWPVTIAAVDCTADNVLCKEEEVKSFPTILAYNFGGVAHGSVMESRKLEDVLGFIKEHLGGAWQEAAAPPGAIAGGTVAVAGEARRPPAQLPFHSFVDEARASAALRVVDAISAVRYGFFEAMFASADPSDLLGSAARRDALVQWVELLSELFPDPQVREVMGKLLRQLGKRDLEKGPLTAAAWEHLLTQSSIVQPGSYDWPTCGASQGAGGDAEAYACGLWTLFHMLAQSAFAHPDIRSADSIVATLKAFVNHFFACEECRRHFVKALDECGRLVLPGTHLHLDVCSLAVEDFPLWLWDLHNAVSLRVLEESGAARRRLYVGHSSGAFPQYLWPSTDLCPGCWTYAGDGEYHVRPEALRSYFDIAFGRKGLRATGRLLRGGPSSPFSGHLPKSLAFALLLGLILVLGVGAMLVDGGRRSRYRPQHRAVPIRLNAMKGRLSTATRRRKSPTF